MRPLSDLGGQVQRCVSKYGLEDWQDLLLINAMVFEIGCLDNLLNRTLSRYSPAEGPRDQSDQALRYETIRWRGRGGSKTWTT